MTPLARHLAATALAAGCLLGTAATAGAVTPAPTSAATPAAPTRVVPASADVVCSVNAASATIRETPGGRELGTMFQGYRFRVDSSDGVWAKGAGYDPNDNLVAAGYILQQYLVC